MSDLLINPYQFGVPSWAPSDLTGLVAWWKADSYVGSDGDLVSTWADSSGNSKDATATTTLRPTYKTNILNGKPVMRFDGNDSMVTPTIDLSATKQASLFAVFSVTASGTDEIIFETGTNYNSTGGLLLYRMSTNAVQHAYKPTPSGGTGRAWVTTGTVTTTHTVYVGKVDTTAVSADRAYGWLNGSNAGAGGGAGTGNVFLTNLACYIGSRAQASVFMTGDIAELGVYSQALGDTDRDNLETYLGAKYGITVA